MTVVLVTGATGQLGGNVTAALVERRRHRVICLVRRQARFRGAETVVGRFDAPDDLRGLAGTGIDVVVHLAAATGAITEETAMAVNVVGTHRLLECLYAGGCRRFVLASSVAAVGCLDSAFIPFSIPIDDDHACLARDPYGLSKALMEEFAFYFQRRHADADIALLRIGPVVSGASVAGHRASDGLKRPFVDLAYVGLEDATAVLVGAVESPPKPGVRRMNVVGPDARCVDPVSVCLRVALGDRAHDLDLSSYDAPAAAFASIYRDERLALEFGIVPISRVQRPPSRRAR